MTAECSSTADSITGVLLAGDAVLNLSSKPLNTTAGTCYVTADQHALSVSRIPTNVAWHVKMLPELMNLRSAGVRRIVVVCEENCSNGAAVTEELDAAGIPNLLCILAETCDADAFMDEEDTEAVTERLRQLGYI